jgi:hypothetical protein
VVAAIQQRTKVRNIALKRIEDQQRAEEALEEKELQIQQRLSDLADQKVQTAYDDRLKQTLKAGEVAMRRSEMEQSKEDLVARAIAKTQAAERRQMILQRQQQDMVGRRVAERWLKKRVGEQQMLQFARRRENELIDIQEREAERQRRLEQIRFQREQQRQQIQKVLVMLSLDVQ